MQNQLFRPWALFALSIVVVAVLVGFLSWNPSSGSIPRTPLVLYCAAGLKSPVEAAVREYEKLTGIPVQVQYGGSQTLLAGIEVSRRGDLYLPAEDTYMTLAREKQLVAETIPLAKMQLVVAVKKGNPKKIKTIDDLLRPDVRLVQADPEAAAVGHVAREILRTLGKWDAIQKRTSVYKLTVTDVANDLKIGSVDAGFCWDAVTAQYPDLEAVKMPELANGQGNVSIGVLRFGTDSAAALKFARFLGAPEHGLKQFGRYRFEPLPGDAWAETPELVLYSGAVNRVAIQESIARFEKREGVKVNCIFNGCGILVAQMKAGGRPDVYLTCDASFVPPVADLFLGTPVEVSQTDIVILVPKGNPRKIQSLADLGQEGLRLGVGNPEESTLGALTRRLLEQAGIYSKVMPNVRTMTPTADMLVNSLVTGSLDAVVVYAANTSKVKDKFDLIRLPGAEAVQTFSVGVNSKQKHLAERFYATLSSAESRNRYESAGFNWRAGAR